MIWLRFGGLRADKLLCSACTAVGPERCILQRRELSPCRDGHCRQSQAKKRAGTFAVYEALAIVECNASRSKGGLNQLKDLFQCIALPYFESEPTVSAEQAGM